MAVNFCSIWIGGNTNVKTKVDCLRFQKVQFKIISGGPFVYLKLASNLVISSRSYN